MSPIRTLRSLLPALLTIACPAMAQETSTTLRIDIEKRGEPIEPFIYGQFIEHMGRCIYGGIWAEMLEDRKFISR
jgi:alpha-L-arabinofuranosidase